MSYLVLARKYRPQNFASVVGQTHVVKTLINALKLGKLSHALLFSGIKGTGKTTIARIVAKALNCKQLQDGYEPCNECSHCQEINRGIFVDVLEIDAASNRGIDQVRELIENLKYAPAKGKAKVYIIDESHMLTKEAANALLKSLEEPPSHVYFILATTEPNKLPPTILSRCQRFDFRRLELKTMAQYLRKICEQENYLMEPSALEFIARESQGSLRDALTFLDQAMAYGATTKEEIIHALGWHEESLVEDLAELLLKKDLSRALKLAEEIFERGLDLIYLTEKLTEFFRNLFLAKALPGEININFQSLKLKESFISTTIEDLLLIFQILLRDLESLKKSSYPQLQFELTLAKICEYDKLMPIRELLKKLEEFSSQVEEIRLPQSQEPRYELTWRGYLEYLEKTSSPLFRVAKLLSPPEITPQAVKLIIKEEESILKSLYLPQLKESVEAFFGKPLEITIEKPKTISQEEIKARPEVQAIMKTFGAKIAYIETTKE